MAWSVGERKNEPKTMGQHRVMEMHPSAKDAPDDAKPKAEMNKERDVTSGMEILELDFLLGVVENTKGSDKNDVTMRKLVFNELIRREQLDTIDSSALKVYTVNESNLYGKDIQCEAMKKLTERTTHKAKDAG